MASVGSVPCLGHGRLTGFKERSTARRDARVGKFMIIPDYAVRAPEHPSAWLERWLVEAETSGELNHTAMALSSLDLKGAPRTRFVLCKGVNRDGLRFFTNLESNKGAELARDPRASVAFYWSILKRQVWIPKKTKLSI